MKSISTQFKAHLAMEVTTIATCWKLTRRDETVLGFTDHDADIVYGGQSYKAATGFTPTAIESSSALNVDNLDVEGLLNSAAITESDLLAGRYDYAEIDVFMVNYADLTQGHMTLKTGWLGEITIRGEQFIAEVRGLSQQLGTRIGEHYAAACRANLGDTRCQVSLGGFSKAGTVTTGTSASQFADTSSSEVAGYFSGGTVRFTSGHNAGLSMEIKEYQNGQFILALPLPNITDAGDSYMAVAGCDKTLKTCAQRFSNAVNFRGEPHVPGTDRLLETAGTRSEW